MNSKEQLFREYHGMAKHVAGRFSRKYNRPIEEAQDYADFALALLLYGDIEYDPSKLDFGAWLGMKIHWHLKEVYVRGRHPRCPEIKEPNAFPREIPSGDMLDANIEKKPSWLSRILREVGEEGAALIRIIADAPEDLIEEVRPLQGRTAEKKQENLNTYLVDVLDWPFWKVRRAFKQVQNCL